MLQNANKKNIQLNLGGDANFGKYSLTWWDLDVLNMKLKLVFGWLSLEDLNQPTA